ncbi:MAG: DNA replication complex subunit Gins51 [Promethearchaeota archaeon]
MGGENKDYEDVFEKLVMLWQTERNSEKKISELSDKDLEMFLEFQKKIHKQYSNSQKLSGNNEFGNDPTLENTKLNADNKTADLIIQDLRINSIKIVDYYINDLLDIRQKKIINICKHLEIIEKEELLTSIEHDFYRTIMSAFKGYKKMRNIYRVIADTSQIKPEYEKTTDIQQKNVLISKSIKVKYSFIRVLNKIPSLVGSDFLVYGPFKKEDIAEIPRLNALIMEKEKLVEIIE